MPVTSLTLLEQLRRPGQAEAWNRFVSLYAPVLLRWAELQGFQDADAEDLAQTVLLKLLRLLPNYQRREGQTFRGWLFRICRNECHDFRTRRATRALPVAPGLSEVATEAPNLDLEEAEYRRQLVRRALELVRPDFTDSSWEAFTRFVIEGRRASDVARELGISANAVYLSRNRILSRIREELAGLID